MRSVHAFRGPVDIEALADCRPNAVALDLALYGERAWTFLSELRHRLPDIGLLVVTQPCSAQQRTAGLELGADDWVEAPCDPDELLARVESVARRRTRTITPAEHDWDSSSASDPVRFGEFELRPDQFQAFLGSRSLDLTPREFALLVVFTEHAGQVLRREQIFELVWGHAMPPGDRAVDAFVVKLRRKLEAAKPGDQMIQTHAGVGYRLRSLDELAAAS
jgi:DNA-binding response OmpR family regulator